MTISKFDISKFDISKIVFYDINKMPIAILTDNKTGIDIGYLSPFRGYCFQISGSVDGDGDYGSSKVVGLGNIWASTTLGSKDSRYNLSNLNWDNTKKEILTGLAMIAINKFAVSVNRIFNNHNYYGKQTTSDGKESWYNTSLDYYIEEVAIWLDNQLG